MPTLRDLRDRALLSQSELAGLCHVRQHTVSLWETGQSSPQAEHRRALVQALHCSPEELLAALQATREAREARERREQAEENERPAA
jgi:transcriptional regulator with XRE-family HTH domain